MSDSQNLCHDKDFKAIKLTANRGTPLSEVKEVNNINPNSCLSLNLSALNLGL